jgi:hypothetical protein
MTLANAPLSARDARLNASDLPDGTSEIFLQPDMDTPQSERRTDLPVGRTRRSEAHSFIVIPGHRAAMNPESRDSGSGPSDHPGMTTRGSPVSRQKFQRLLARRKAAEFDVIGIVLRRFRGPQDHELVAFLLDQFSEVFTLEG